MTPLGCQITTCMKWALKVLTRSDFLRWLRLCFLKILKLEIWPPFGHFRQKWGQITTCLKWAVMVLIRCDFLGGLQMCNFKNLKREIWPFLAIFWADRSNYDFLEIGRYGFRSMRFFTGIMSDDRAAPPSGAESARATSLMTKEQREAGLKARV